MKVLVSACLAGCRCRYDGGDKADPEIVRLVEAGEAVPVCPEELGGLGTPRPPAGIAGGGGREVVEGTARVLTRDGAADVTDAYLKGAHETLRIAREVGATKALLKQHSPSCGCGSTGSAEGVRLAADGVTTALLKRAGLEVVPADD